MLTADNQRRLLEVVAPIGSEARKRVPWSITLAVFAERFRAQGLCEVKVMKDGTRPNVLTRAGIEAVKDLLCDCSIPAEDQVNVIPGRVFVGWGIGWDTCPSCHGTGRK
jgi:hypothetical protein